MRGKKVGVIGTGSSGIQAVPILAVEAESLVVFQRSPNYTVPMPNYPSSDEDLGRIRREYPERRSRRSAYAPAGTPHGTYDKNASTRIPKSGRRRCGVAGVTAGCCSARRSPTRRRCSRPTTSRGSSSRTASARLLTTDRCGGSHSGGLPDRDEAHLH